MTLPSEKQKPRPQSGGALSWLDGILDVVMPRPPVIRYGTETSAEDVIKTIKALDNHTSRIVIVAKKPTPQGLHYNFRLEFREFKETNDSLQRHGRRPKEWVTVKQIDGTVMAGTEYPTYIEFTSERMTTSVMAGFSMIPFILLTLAIDWPMSTKTPILIGEIILAAFLFIGPYIFVTYRPRNTMLERRMQDVVDRIGGVRLDDDAAPKPKRRAASKSKVKDL